MTGNPSGTESNDVDALPTSDIKQSSSLLGSPICHSAAVAIWWTLHAWVATTFLRVALGEFNGSRLGAGSFQTAEMAQVLQFLGLRISPWPAFGLATLAIFAIAIVARYLWHVALNALRIGDLNSITKEALQWAAKKQLLSGWGMVAVACLGLTLLALRFSEYGPLGWAAGVVLLIVYATPILVLRPRWLGGSSSDLSMLPGIAAIGTSVLLSILDWALSVSLSALMGKFGGLLSFVSTLLLVWLTASALLFVRRVGDIRSVLTARLTPAFSRWFCLALPDRWDFSLYG